MDEFLSKVLMSGVLSDHRQDTAVARQGVMNHQVSCHLMDLEFIQQANEFSITEAIAMQGINASQLPRDVAGLQTAAGTPAQGSVTNNLGKAA